MRVLRRNLSRSTRRPWVGMVAAGPYVGGSDSKRDDKISGVDAERVCRCTIMV